MVRCPIVHLVATIEILLSKAPFNIMVVEYDEQQLYLELCSQIPSSLYVWRACHKLVMLSTWIVMMKAYLGQSVHWC